MHAQNKFFETNDSFRHDLPERLKNELAYRERRGGLK